MNSKQILSPCLWYDGDAEEAAAFYVSVFPNSRIDDVHRSPTDWPAGKAGDVLLVSFTIAGMSYQALNGGPDQAFNNSVSLSIACDDQQEVDRYWEALTADGGEPIQCGWNAVASNPWMTNKEQTMSYIDGFVIAVPSENKQKFFDHAKLGDSVFIDLGATRVIECWGDDVQPGKLTDFRKAVQARDDETVVFSWIEWPDKATRDAAMKKMTDWMNNPEETDPRMDPEKNPMPFDGKRLIYGGFEPLVELLAGAGG